MLTTFLIAQANEMQSWNPGDEFAAARAAALAELEAGYHRRRPVPRHSVSLSASRRARTKSRSDRRFRYFND